MRRIMAITGARSEYGILKPVFAQLHESVFLDLKVIVSGMHLSPDHGMTVNEVVADGWPIAAKVEMLLRSDSMAAMGKGVGLGVYGMTHEIERYHPDVVLVLGDRVEAFAGTIAGVFSGAVVAHIHGGDISQGGMDEYMRHAITKLSHVHFAATERSRERIAQMGENKDYVHCTGTPGLDALLAYPEYSNEELSSQLGFEPEERFILVVQHPVSTHGESAAEEIKITLEAVKQTGLPCVLIYPNADAGSREMIKFIQSHECEPWLKTLVNVSRDVYCNLLRRAAVLVGNSSSGMIDAPAYGVPVVNIGERQAGRERGDNVIDAPAEYGAVEEAIQRALNDQSFIEMAQKTSNPYGDGRASMRIREVLETVDLEGAKSGKHRVWHTY